MSAERASLPDRKTSALYARWRRLVDEREDRLSDVPLYSEFLEVEVARLRAALDDIAGFMDAALHTADCGDETAGYLNEADRVAREALNGGECVCADTSSRNCPAHQNGGDS